MLCLPHSSKMNNLSNFYKNKRMFNTLLQIIIRFLVQLLLHIMLKNKDIVLPRDEDKLISLMEEEMKTYFNTPKKEKRQIVIKGKTVSIPAKKLKRIGKYTLAIFLERAAIVHGNKYDYSKIKESDLSNGARSYVTIICHAHDNDYENGEHFEWKQIVSGHITGKHGCTECVGAARYTLKIFLMKAKKVHGDEYDYSEIKESDVKNCKSRVTVICHKHDNEYKNCLPFKWTPTIHMHINSGSGCPECVSCTRWTFNRVIDAVKRIYKNRYDYSEITPNHIKNGLSKLSIICHRHKESFRFFPSISNHITQKTGCSLCYGNTPWNLTRAIERANEIHGIDTYNYLETKESDIVNKGSRLTVICYSHNSPYTWKPLLTEHINKGRGCPECAGYRPWNLPKLISRSNKVYGENRYDFSQTDGDSIENQKTEVTVICHDSSHSIPHVWNVKIVNFINHKMGCPACRLSSSKGEKICFGYLQTKDINPTLEFKLPNLPKRRFDFMF